MYQDKTLTCTDCGSEFAFTSGEQEFYAEKGFQNDPKRCKSCKEVKKNAMRNNREIFEAECASCGSIAKVPFKPIEDRPVYCSSCFAEKSN